MFASKRKKKIPSFVEQWIEASVIPLKELFNMSVEGNFFPDSWNLSKVDPIMKPRYRDDAKNYAFTSILKIILYRKKYFGTSNWFYGKEIYCFQLYTF